MLRSDHTYTSMLFAHIGPAPGPLPPPLHSLEGKTTEAATGSSTSCRVAFYHALLASSWHIGN